MESGFGRADWWQTENGFVFVYFHLFALAEWAVWMMYWTWAMAKVEESEWEREKGKENRRLGVHVIWIGRFYYIVAGSIAVNHHLIYLSEFK